MDHNSSRIRANFAPTASEFWSPFPIAGLSFGCVKWLGRGGNATRNTSQPSALLFRRNWKLLLHLCRASCREQTNLRPVTRGNSFVTKSGSHVLVPESFAEWPSRATPERAVRNGQKM